MLGYAIPTLALIMCWPAKTNDAKKKSSPSESTT
jgi:hypothetical protein